VQLVELVVEVLQHARAAGAGAAAEAVAINPADDRRLAG